MTLLAPWLLALAAAIGVPIFVHFSRRRRTDRLPFPAVRYLETAEREQRRTRTLEQRVLLALRLLAVLALALAAARPLLTALSGRPALALAVVLDNSLSTARRVPAAAADRDGTGTRAGAPVLETLVADARALLEAQPAGSRLWLLTADGQVRSGPAATLTRALDSVSAFAGAGALDDALGRARRLVASAAELPPAIALLTDGQALPRDSVGAASPISTVALARRALGRSGTPTLLNGEANRAITDVRITPTRWTGQGTVHFRVVGDSTAGDTVAWRVRLGEQLVAQGVAARGREVSATVGTTVRGWVPGRIELTADALPLDDVRPFVADVRPPTEVRVDPTAGPFVEAAVATLRTARLVGDGTRPDRAPPIPIVRADLLAATPSVIIAPSSPAAIATANTALARLAVPWQFAAYTGDSAVAVLRDSALAAGQPEGVIVQRRVRLVPVAASGGTRRRAIDTLATVRGEPWIVAGDGYLLIASPLEPTATSLVLSAGFVPWLGARLSAGLEAAHPIWPSTPRAVVPADFPCDTVRSPGGEGLVLGRDLADRRRGPREPGVYLCARGARSAALVVSPDDEESVAGTIDDDALRAGLGSTRARVVTDRRALLEAVATQPGGRSATPWLLAVALLALLAESVVARRGVRRAVAPQAATSAPLAREATA